MNVLSGTKERTAGHTSCYHSIKFFCFYFVLKLNKQKTESTGAERVREVIGLGPHLHLKRKQLGVVRHKKLQINLFL